MHPSNLIPQGAWPVPIDWECLLSPLDHDEAGPVEDTCLFTGLSPSWKMDLKRTQGYYSYGLAEGPRAWVAPLPRFVWEDAGRSIRLRPVEVKGFDRRQVWMLRHPHQHLDSFLAGFQECFRWAMRHGVTRWLPLIQQAFGGLAPRYVARPTQAYRDTLFQMLAPAGLKDGLAYGVAAEQAITHLPHFLRGSARYPAMRHYEKRTLFEQDIPIFGGQTDGTLLLDGQGNALGPLLPRPPLAQLAARLQRADEAGMAWQTSCLSAFYASIGISRQERRMVPVSPEQLCRHLADAAMRLRVHPRQGHTGWLEWVPVHPNSTVLHPALAPSSLYDGSDGNALFLLWAGVWMHRPDWRAAGNDGLAYGADAASALLERAKAGEAILSPCAFTGPVLSSVYAHLLAAQWLPEAETRLWQLAGALREAGPEAFGAYPHDYVGGMASGLLLLARLLERARVGTAPWPLGWLERWIGEWRQALWEQIAAVEGPLPGMAHGQAGWLWALWESARVLGEGAAESDREALQDLAGKVADAAARQDGAKPSHAWWCAGLPGMALVLARLAQAGAPLGAAALQALRALEQLPDAKGDHLCCGEAGRWLAWQEASAVLGQTAYPRAGHLLRRFSRKGQWQYQRYAEGSIAPGALTGTPGIGIALLQMLFPQKNPCIFMLDSPPIAK
jgi:lantibiotic modifying enzyme